jgi:drug/metabolite transporter (DMT)-like permease
MVLASLSPRLIGELLALGTAFCWTGSAVCFETASRRAGSVAVNLIRLVVAFGFLCIYGAIHRGRALPTDATAHHWRWLLASGAVGFFIGDLCLFRAFVVLGARLSTLLMSLAPPIAAMTGYLVLGEQLGPWSFLGMVVTLGGILWVVSERTKEPASVAPDLDAEELGAPVQAAATIEYKTPIQARGAPISGVVLGVLGAAGQGVGLVLTKLGMSGAPGSVVPALDPFAATQIRALAGIVIFAAFVTAVGRWNDVRRALINSGAMFYLTLGAIFGPFLGVSLLNASIVSISTGIAQTLAAMVPVIIIPFVVFTKREHVSWRAAIGAIVAVAGVAILLMRGSM